MLELLLEVDEVGADRRGVTRGVVFPRGVLTVLPPPPKPLEKADDDDIIG